MKINFSLLALIICLMAYSQFSWAAFSMEELHTATKTAADVFKKSNSEHAAHFTGYKSWLSGEESKVKIYVAHDGMTMDFNYVCHKHEDEIECHAQ